MQRTVLDMGDALRADRNLGHEKKNQMGYKPVHTNTFTVKKIQISEPNTEDNWL